MPRRVVVLLLGSLLAAGLTAEEVTFESSDGVTVYGDLHRADAPDDAPLILLLHQSASSTVEYEPLVPILLERGFHALAVDARGGGGPNRTVARLPHHGGGREAYHDFKAALAFVRERGFDGPIGIVGSSYSAGRIFQVLAEQPPGVRALAAFSPGAAFATDIDGAPAWASNVTIPVLMTWAPDELDDERRARFERIASDDKQLLIQATGVHGASTLHPQRNPEGWQANVDALLAFFESRLRPGPSPD